MAPIESRSVNDFVNWQPPPIKEILGKGILYEGGKIIIYGRYKTFKSMLAKTIGLCIAYGIPFQGDIPVPKDGASVYYLQAEISDRLLHKRLVPMWNNTPKTQEKPLAPMYIANAPYCLLDQDWGRMEFEDEINRLRPEVVIIDPLYKFMSGSITDPNSAAAFLRTLDELQSMYNFAIILIHHSRKRPSQGGDEDTNDSDDMMGAQTFSAWADGVIKLKPKGGDIRENRNNVVMDFKAMRHTEVEIDPIELYFDRNTLQFKDVTIKI